MRYKKTESSVIRQKGKYQGGDYKKTKHTKFSKKRTFLTPWYVPVRNYLITDEMVYTQKKNFVSMAPKTVLKEHRKEQLKDYNMNRHIIKDCKKQKQPSRCVLKKCSENILKIFMRTPMPKCDFNKVALQLYWSHTLAWVFSVKFAAYFQNTFFKKLWKNNNNRTTFTLRRIVKQKTVILKLKNNFLKIKAFVKTTKTWRVWPSDIRRLHIGRLCFYIGHCPMSSAFFRSGE